MALWRSDRLRALGVPAPGLAARVLAPSIAALAGALVLACAPSGDAIVVLAAASLNESFQDLGAAFERAHPETSIVFSFAGSQTLAMQLRAGAGADVIATANPQIMDALAADGLVVDPEPFATNQLVWIAAPERAPRDSVELVETLPDSDWTLVLAAPEVPAGRYARAALQKLGLTEAAQTRVVSNELDVKGVLAKVQLGEADLGIVYATDVPSEIPHRVVVYKLPASARTQAQYVAAVVAGAGQPDAAAAFVQFLGSSEGQRILSRGGFGAP